MKGFVFKCCMCIITHISSICNFVCLSGLLMWLWGKNDTLLCDPWKSKMNKFSITWEKKNWKMHQVYRKVTEERKLKKSLYNGKDALLVRPNLFTWLIILFFYPRSISWSCLTLVLYLMMFLQFKFKPLPNGTRTCLLYTSDACRRS